MSEKNILSKGIEFYKAKRYNDALTFFLSLPENSGADNLEISYYLGLLYTKLNRYEDALNYLEQVVTSGKTLDRVLQCRFILAIIYCLSGRKRLASFELEKLSQSGYKTASVYAASAFIAWEDSDVEKCLQYYEKSLEIDPENRTALNGLGYVLACEDKELTKALSCCKKAVNSSPHSAACLDSLGWVYYKLGMYKDAKKYLEMAEQLEPKNQEIAEHLRILMVDGENKNEN